MKTLRLFGMAIVAVMLAMPATSCDDDDDDDDTQIETTEDGIVTGQKKLVKIVEYEEEREGSYVNIDLDSIVLRYDSKGRLIRWEEDSYDSEGSGFVYDHAVIETYAWAENSIAYHYSEHNSENSYTGDYTYVLSDNLVTGLTRSDYNYDAYQYDSDKRIAITTEIDGSYTHEYYYSWEGDKMVKFSDVGDVDYEFNYSGKTCKGYSPLLGGVLDALGFAHPELFGARTNQLPDYEICRNKYGDGIRNEFSYTFYSDGYLETVTKTYEGGRYYIKETYFWE